MENIEDLRLMVHQNVENTYDGELLLIVNDLMVRKITNIEPELPQWRVDRINKAKENLKHGIYFTNEQVKSMVEQWRNK